MLHSSGSVGIFLDSDFGRSQTERIVAFNCDNAKSFPQLNVSVEISDPRKSELQKEQFNAGCLNDLRANGCSLKEGWYRKHTNSRPPNGHWKLPHFPVFDMLKTIYGDFLGIRWAEPERVNRWRWGFQTRHFIRVWRGERSFLVMISVSY